MLGMAVVDVLPGLPSIYQHASLQLRTQSHTMTEQGEEDPV